VIDVAFVQRINDHVTLFKYRCDPVQDILELKEPCLVPYLILCSPVELDQDSGGQAALAGQLSEKGPRE